MSQSPSDEKEKEKGKKKKKEKRRRSPIELIVVWALILGLAGVAGNQYLQKQAYDSHLKIINDALERSNPEAQVNYEEIRGQLSKEPEISDTNYGGVAAKLYTWRWKGIREYRIELVVNKDSGNLLMLKPAGE